MPDASLYTALHVRPLDETTAGLQHVLQFMVLGLRFGYDMAANDCRYG